MTKSVTLARLPRATANSKPHHSKQKIQKMKDLTKTWVLTGKQFEDFRRKKIHFQRQPNNPLKSMPSKTRRDDGPCNQDEIN